MPQYETVEIVRDTSKVSLLAMTIELFCRSHSMGKNTYYKLQANGKGPTEIRLGTKVLISVEDAAEWRRSRANPEPEETAAIDAESARLSDRARHAGEVAAQSPRHVSKRRGARLYP